MLGQISEVLDINFFELKYLRTFVKEVYDFKEKYKVFPNQETFKTLLENKYYPETRETEIEPFLRQLKDFFNRYSQKSNSINSDFVKINAIEFCKKQKLKEAMIKSVELLKTLSFDEIKSHINKAISLGINHNFGTEYIDHFEERYKPNYRSPVSTGWPVLDGYIKGGLSAGELGCFIGRALV